MPDIDLPTSMSHSRVPDVHTSIYVNGHKTPLYSIEEKGSKVIAYIEAIDEAAFEFGWKDKSTGLVTDYAMGAHVDGTFCDGFLGTENGKAIPHGHKISSFRESGTSVRPFKFGKLLLTDDEAISSNEENFVKNVGALQLSYRRVGYIGRSEAVSKDFSVQQKSLHEQSKKAQLSHQASFAPSISTPQIYSFSCTYIDSENEPFVWYEFRYRSKTLLELEGRIPGYVPPPSPKQVRAKRTIDLTADSDGEAEGNEAEERRLRARLAQLESKKSGKDKKPKIKKEGASGKAGKAVQVVQID